MKGDDWGFGYNLRLAVDINERARVGMNYRSKISHTLKGDGEWHLVGNAFNDPVLGSTIQQGIRDRGYADKEDASVKITTPESLSVHGMYQNRPEMECLRRCNVDAPLALQPRRSDVGQRQRCDCR